MKNRSVPMRRCIGCMESKPKSELIRIACYEGEVSVDRTGRARGRGVYLCPREECLQRAAKKKALQRSLKVKITDEDAGRLLQEIRDHDE